MGHPKSPTTRTRREFHLPSNRSFVVHIEAHVEIHKGQFQGRVEHLVTGRHAWFESIDRLLGFIEENL
ncbi:MAG: hypothetical protein ACU841_08345 [Gammaproteobacteria bacterium]